ncbi:MAG: hypothetical protein PHF17_03770 [Arcobacteraceae bacterium]|jgi:DNA-binding NarL/FixJ family response regulator|nr:hypothetical protein [Arcobacteraceae bacterium]
MKILIYDNNPNDLSKLCDMLQSIPTDFIIDKVSHYQDGFEFFSKYEYDMVFIDFADDIGKKLLAFILEIKPKQKVVIMSEISGCSDVHSCENCKEKYNKQRVLKPIAQNELLKIVVKEENCSQYCDDDLMIDLALIGKRLNTLVFDKEKFTFKKVGYNYHKNMSEIIQLTYDLSEKDIQYELTDDGISILR